MRPAFVIILNNKSIIKSTLLRSQFKYCFPTPYIRYEIFLQKIVDYRKDRLFDKTVLSVYDYIIFLVSLDRTDFQMKKPRFLVLTQLHKITHTLCLEIETGCDGVSIKKSLSLLIIALRCSVMATGVIISCSSPSTSTDQTVSFLSSSLPSTETKRFVSFLLKKSNDPIVYSFYLFYKILKNI